MPRVLRVSEILRRITMWCERLLAVSMLVGMSVFFFFSIAAMSAIDWNQTDSLYDLINRILLLVICLELIRTLLTHDLEAVLELLAFVVARKTLKPDLSVTDILFCVFSFVILMAARRFLIKPDASLEALKEEQDIV